MSAAIHGLLYGLAVEACAIGAYAAVALFLRVVTRGAAGHVEFPVLGFTGLHVGCVIGAIQVHAWWRLPVYVVALAVVGTWWWRRKKRRSVAALIGAKSKAARDALVRRARETVRPRPVLKPSPVPR